MSQKISQTILSKIKTQNLQPRSRYYFLIKNYLIWLALGGAIFLAGILFATIFLDFQSQALIRAGNFSQGILNFLPQKVVIFWFLTLALTIAAALHLLRQTERGYRLTSVLLIIGFGVLILILAAGFWHTNLPKHLNEFSVERFNQKPFSEDSLEEKTTIFGAITEVSAEQLVLETPEKEVWQVDLRRARTPPFLHLKPQTQIKVVGTKQEGQKLQASFILPQGDSAQFQQSKKQPRQGQDAGQTKPARKFHRQAY